MNTTYTTPKVILGVAGLVMALTLVSLPLFADAATYAYVDTTGEVKPVLADTWQQAIAKAVGIHIHSGVMLLDSPEDFDIVGNDVSGY
ncbi:MAG: hypothetical protein RLZZ480_454 [Candidatus Parcubacteria bacterium]|jgi:hypothetical protein